MAKPYFHPSAIVETEHIGDDTKIWAFSHILKGVEIGSQCNIGDHCFMEGGVKIGNGVTIKNGNMLFEGIELQDGVFVGPHVFFTNDLFPRSPRMPEAKNRYQDHTWFKPTLVKYGATLGAGAIILAGVVIGEFATVGAGSVVTKDISPYALVIGNPAKRVAWVCQCGLKLKLQNDKGICIPCQKEYEQVQGNLVLVDNKAAPRT